MSRRRRLSPALVALVLALYLPLVDAASLDGAAVQGRRPPREPGARQTVVTVDGVPDGFLPVPETLFLNQGAAYRTIEIDFLSIGDLGPTPQPKISIDQEDAVLSRHDITRVTQFETNTYIVIVHLTFEDMPGSTRFSISLPGPDGNDLVCTSEFLVVGIVLFETNGDTNTILTGMNTRSLNLRALDTSILGRTVNATVFTGTSLNSGNVPIERSSIRVITSVNGQDTDLLPWDPNACRISVDEDRLDDICSMAFSPDFTTFSMRVPASQRSSFDPDIELRISFEWPGIMNFSNSATGELGVNTDNPNTPLTTDIITSVTVERPLDVPGLEEPPSGKLTAWMIAVIVVTSLLLLIAFLLFLCCCVCGKPHRRPEPNVRNVSESFQRMGERFRTRPLERPPPPPLPAHHDHYHVEAPPSPEVLSTRASTSAPPESLRSRAPDPLDLADSMLPPPPTPPAPPTRSDRAPDKSVTRIVLPKRFNRGVELPASTHGGSELADGAAPDERDVPSYDVPSSYAPPRAYANGAVPENSYGQEHGVRDLSYTDELTEADVAAAAAAAAGEFGDFGVPDEHERLGDRRSREWSGVGAAINRVRQVDLLNGPVSAGLIASGEEVRQRRDDRDGGGKQHEGPMTDSTVS